MNASNNSSSENSANSFKKLFADNYSRKTFIRDFNLSIERTWTEFPLGLK